MNELFSVVCDEPKGPVTRTVRSFPFTKENLSALYEKVSKFPTLMGNEVNSFDEMLRVFLSISEDGNVDSKGLCVVVDDLVGIFWLTDIRWPIQASIHYTFFDRRHRGRTELCKTAIKYVFEVYKFQRLYTHVPLYAHSVLSFIESLGFKKSGRERKNSCFKGTWYDTFIYDVLQGEL